MTNPVNPRHTPHKNTPVFLAYHEPPTTHPGVSKAVPLALIYENVFINRRLAGGYRNTVGIDMHPHVKKRPNPALWYIPLLFI